MKNDEQKISKKRNVRSNFVVVIEFINNINMLCSAMHRSSPLPTIHMCDHITGRKLEMGIQSHLAQYFIGSMIKKNEEILRSNNRSDFVRCCFCQFFAAPCTSTSMSEQTTPILREQNAIE